MAQLPRKNVRFYGESNQKKTGDAGNISCHKHSFVRKEVLIIN